MSRIVDIVKASLPDLEKSSCGSFQVSLPKPLVLEQQDISDVVDFIRDMPLKMREKIKVELFEADLANYKYSRERVDRYTQLDRWYSESMQGQK